MPKNVPDSILYSFEQIIITLKRTSREIAIRSRCNRRPCFLSFGVKSLRIRPMCYGCARARRCYLPNSFSYYVSDLFTRHFFYDSQTETWSLFIKYTHERVVLWRSKCSSLFSKNYISPILLQIQYYANTALLDETLYVTHIKKYYFAILNFIN